ncbi:hypothetical protein NP233_g1868 [Leucocoprinus birnbaumii]|uniref:Uncharacterized protein n=1 Tax=Leucocoprinus birnbaumii TaxID=56174 RepID=A0AAD5YZE3_9AGAR|nr:hypothetical protein NP233_g1868 [Leucocoprinus birnbaumii]
MPATHRLANILLLPSYTSTQSHLRLRASRYSVGEIWKHIFSVCVHSDLEGIDTISLRGRNLRFARLEESGLSGVILYELPVIQDPHGTRRWRPAVTLEDVFGSKEMDYEDGMTIQDLLDLTSARLVYFPAYACTSFFAGQAMHAFLSDSCQSRPQPALDGFFVFTGSPVHLSKSSFPDSATDDTVTAIQSCEIASPEGSPSSDSDGFEHEHLAGQCDSSLDSFGPSTPPRSSSPPIQERSPKLDQALSLSF